MVRSPLETALAEAGERLAERGGRREALRLWRGAQGAPTDPLIAHIDRPDPSALARFRTWVSRRAGGEPLPYITGRAGFRHLELEVGPAVLIPRPETEWLVQHVLDWSRRRDRWGVAIDVGAGSGCIALSLAQEGRFALVVGSEYSSEALYLARRNQGHVSVSVNWIRGDLLDSLEDRSVDVVVSNPPYLTDEEYRNADPSVRLYEPAQALRAGPDGMAVLERLVGTAQRVLKPGGLLAVEIDERRGDRTVALARRGGLVHATIERDLFGCDRYLLAEAP